MIIRVYTTFYNAIINQQFAAGKLQIMIPEASAHEMFTPFFCKKNCQQIKLD